MEDGGRRCKRHHKGHGVTREDRLTARFCGSCRLPPAGAERNGKVHRVMNDDPSQLLWNLHLS